jgi:transposase InsO family protein
MSKRQQMVLSVTVQRLSQADTARLYGVSEATVSRLMGRYRVDGDAAFEPRSRRPHKSPKALSAEVVALIVNLRAELVAAGWDAGPETIATHLEQRHGIVVSIATIRRRLIAHGLIEPAPRKRPKSSYIRFEAELPNECWQTDFTHWRLADRTDTEILCWLDDHSRYALSVTAHKAVTGRIVVDTFTETGENTGLPASVLSDNGLVYTTRFAGGRGGRNHLEVLLAELGIDQKHSKPNHPTTCGKVERFHQTLKLWLAAQTPAASIDQLQEQLDKFVVAYNHDRPHRSLNRRTPAVVYNLLPKTGPGDNGAGDHYRIRRDKVHTNGAISYRRGGRMHHIGVGRAHAAKRVLILSVGLDIRVIDQASGELLRHLELDPNRDYQPRPK